MGTGRWFTLVSDIWLPPSSSQVDGINIDHDTLYVPWGKADIFFPTDFDALGRLYRAAADHVWDGQGGGKIKTAHYHQVRALL